jgi:hypothetical protein
LIGTTERIPVFEELEKAKKRAVNDLSLLKRIDWAIDSFQKQRRI